jgi:hypothetical protein
MCRQVHPSVLDWRRSASPPASIRALAIVRCPWLHAKQARACHRSSCFEEFIEEAPGFLDNGFHNLEMPSLRRHFERRGPIHGSKEQQLLPACLDESHDRDYVGMPLLASQVEALESVLVCFEKQRLPARLNQILGNFNMVHPTGKQTGPTARCLAGTAVNRPVLKII